MTQGLETAAQVTDIMNSIRRIVQALRVASRAQEKKNGLSAAQFLVLQCLSGDGPMSVNDLAERTFTHQSSVSVVVSKLVNQNLAERRTAAGDARKVQVSLTPAGAALAQKKDPLIQEQMFAALRKMPEAKRIQFAERLREFLSEAQISDHSPAMFFEEDEATEGT